jgi:hypothetical protein
MQKTNLLTIAFIAGISGFPIATINSAIAAPQAQEVQSFNVPSPLTTIGESGEHAFEMIYAGKSGKALHDIIKMHKNATRLENELGSGELDAIYDSISELEKALSANDVHEALVASNHITYLAAEATRPYHPSMPVEVVLLDYYGRELQIWSRANELSKLKKTSDAINKVWGNLSSDVQRHNGNNEANRFSELVSQLGQASTLVQYQLLAEPFLQEVDNLEKVYGQ